MKQITVALKTVLLIAVLALLATYKGGIFTDPGHEAAGPGFAGSSEEKLLEVSHVNGFQGVLSDGSLIEIEVTSADDGDQPFTLYIRGVGSGTGMLTQSGASITAIKNCTNSSLTYSGGVLYSGVKIPIRKADDTVWVHWGAYYGTTMAEFNGYAHEHDGDADSMYDNRPEPDDQGYYYNSPSVPASYDTPRNIYNQARKDYREDAPHISVLNQAIRVLNDHKNTGVGAYESRGNLIAYY
jgi:hypothetical protein